MEGRNGLFGRKDIYLYGEISENNIVARVNEVLQYHAQNVADENELYWRRRGINPILDRRKEVRPDINNKVVESAGLIDHVVSFDNGWLLTQPAYYVARKSGAQKKVNKLNEYLYLSGKQNVDNETVDWFHTVGKGVIWVKSTDDKRTPCKVYSLDPRSAFVVYSLNVEKEPVMGVHVVTNGSDVIVDAITKDKYYRLMGTSLTYNVTTYPISASTVNRIESVTPNALGKIPIIEYSWNENNLASAELALPLLDCLDTIQSDRANAVAQFVQSLLVTWNCKFDEGMDANTIRQYGLINLVADGENRQDIKILSDQLDQTQTQTFVDDLYERILTICCVPTTTKGGTSTSDTGAAVLARDGFVQADMKARNSEDVFKKSNSYFDEIFLEILRRKRVLDIDPSDFDLLFVRNETSNIQSKAQAMQTLINAGLAPWLALGKSGVSNDPVADYTASEPWIKQRWGDPYAEPEGDMSGAPSGGGGSDEKAPAPAAPKGTNMSQQRKGWVNGYYRG